MQVLHVLEVDVGSIFKAQVVEVVEHEQVVVANLLVGDHRALAPTAIAIASSTRIGIAVDADDVSSSLVGNGGSYQCQRGGRNGLGGRSVLVVVLGHNGKGIVSTILQSADGKGNLSAAVTLGGVGLAVLVGNNVCHLS